MHLEFIFLNTFGKFDPFCWQLWQRYVFANEGESREFRLSIVGGNTSVVVTLAWMDLPTEGASGEPALRNDLDLKVSRSDSILFIFPVANFHDVAVHLHASTAKATFKQCNSKVSLHLRTSCLHPT